MAQRLAYLPYALVFLGLVALSAVSLPPTPVEAVSYCGQIETEYPGEHPDCDGFTSSREEYLETYRYVGCPATATPNDEYTDAWPVDLDDNRLANISDVTHYSQWFNQFVPPAPKRMDLNEDGRININDVTYYSAYFNKSCVIQEILESTPPVSISRYIRTTDTDIMDAQGCEAASPLNLGDGGAVLLIFGPPRVWEEGVGTVIYGQGDENEDFRNAAEIRDAGIAFLRGFYRCRAANTPYLFLAIGTNSDDSFGGVNFTHGAWWEAIVRSVNDWIANAGYTSIMEAIGGNDIEAGGFESPWAQPGDGFTDGALAWVNGFDLAGTQGYIYFGDAGGCIEISYPNCNGDWTWGDIYWVSAGNPAAFVAVPQIYLRDGTTANQWFTLFDWARDNKPSILWIGGALTQEGACAYNAEHNDFTCYVPGEETDNPSGQAYSTLFTHFFSDDDPFPQPLSILTDITWQCTSPLMEC